MKNPYEGKIPEIPQELKDELLNCYRGFYEKLTGLSPELEEEQSPKLLTDIFFRYGIPQKASTCCVIPNVWMSNG